MVLKYGVEKILCRVANKYLIGANKRASFRAVCSYFTSPNYVCLRCHRTSSPNYPLGLLIGLLYTNVRASTVLQRAGAVLQHRSGGPEQY